MYMCYNENMATTTREANAMTELRAPGRHETEQTGAGATQLAGLAVRGGLPAVEPLALITHNGKRWGDDDDRTPMVRLAIPHGASWAITTNLTPAEAGRLATQLRDAARCARRA